MRSLLESQLQCGFFFGVPKQQPVAKNQFDFAISGRLLWKSLPKLFYVLPRVFFEFGNVAFNIVRCEG
jgi:hypothetical protein